MGGTVSAVVETEKVNWAKNHSLEIDSDLRDQQLPLLEKFGDRLFLCSQQRSMMGCGYFHFFVTDGSWTIEFGGGDVLLCTALVHNNPKGEYEQEKSVRKTPE